MLCALKVGKNPEGLKLEESHSFFVSTKNGAGVVHMSHRLPLHLSKVGSHASFGYLHHKALSLRPGVFVGF